MVLFSKHNMSSFQNKKRMSRESRYRKYHLRMNKALLSLGKYLLLCSVNIIQINFMVIIINRIYSTLFVQYQLKSCACIVPMNSRLRQILAMLFLFQCQLLYFLEAYISQTHAYSKQSLLSAKTLQIFNQSELQQ